MRQRMQTRIPSGRERVPAVFHANREFSVWHKVKGAQFISALALLFWGALFFVILS